MKNKRTSTEETLRTIALERFQSDIEERLRPTPCDSEEDDPSNW